MTTKTRPKANTKTAARATVRTPAKSATIRARTTPRLKADAERIFERLGITSSEAINLFYSQVTLRKGIPFAVNIPNAETRATLERSARGEDLVYCDDIEDMFRKLNV